MGSVAHLGLRTVHTELYIIKKYGSKFLSSAVMLAGKEQPCIVISAVQGSFER